MTTQAVSAQQQAREIRELNAAVEQAVKLTEEEVLADALGSEELERSGEDSLEQMGEGLEGDDLDEESNEDAEQPDNVDAAAKDDETDEDETRHAQADDEAEEGRGRGEREDGDREARAQGRDGQRERADQEGHYDRRRGFVPSSRLREVNDRARMIETEMTSRLDAINARIDALLNARQAPQGQRDQQQTGTERQTPRQAPDMFADPEGYRQFVLDEAAKLADERVARAVGSIRQEQQQAQEARLNAAFEAEATSPRAYEFNTAYRDLTSLDPNVPGNRTLVNRITSSPDPVKALYEWWEKDSHPDYIDNVRNQVRSHYAPARGNGRQVEQRGFDRQTQPEPRREWRNPRSLNGATGGGSQHRDDARGLDGSDQSIFGSAFGR
jgi:hypothetical protein